MADSSFLTSTRARTVALGAALTLLVLVLDAAGVLTPLEHWLYDMRTRHCQFFLARPTDQLVHLDIDDASLKAIGRWPWKRSELAIVLDELRLAGAAVIGIDILFPEPQEPEWRSDDQGMVTIIDHDQALARAIAAHGRVILATEPDHPPVEKLRQHALDVGLVGYAQRQEAVLRTVPLIHESDNGQLTAMGILMAWHMLGIEKSATGVSDDALTVAFPTGQVRVPLLPQLMQQTSEGVYRADVYVPWFGLTGSDTWKTMYDWPEHRESVQHFPIHRVHEVGTKAKLLHAAAVETVRYLRDYISSSVDRLEEALAADEAEGGTRCVDELLPVILREDVEPLRASLEGVDDLDDEETLMLARLNDAVEAINNYLKIAEHRQWLRRIFGGKAVLIGWSATATYDQVPTPLHPKAPGVIVHGAVFNAAMTDQWLAPAPLWLNLLLTAALGVLATCAVIALGPITAALTVMALAAGYTLLNGILLFDYANTVVALAAPLAAVSLTWAGCTVTLFVLEQLERARITRRFRSYVDPALVDYVLAHPESTNLGGIERELTVVFTDLAGFTTLSEKLRANIVPLLSEYLQRMVPLIRERRGYVNKFLGDGMMFFYGAPVENPNHAIDAVATVLRMQENLRQFNQILAQRGLSSLAMRAGIGSGPMVVGDAGPADACDYTVIGDTVNLAARLESANKATGTWILINQRGRDLVADHFLIRPIANLQVVGKTEGVFVYEPLCPMAEATPEQKRLAELTTKMVEAFQQARFSDCLAAASELDEAFGRSKLTNLYRDACQPYLNSPPPPDFTGRIVLTDK